MLRCFSTIYRTARVQPRQYHFLNVTPLSQHPVCDCDFWRRSLEIAEWLYRGIDARRKTDSRRRLEMHDKQARDGRRAFFRAFSAHARRSVCVFFRGMREGEFNNAAGKWRRVFRDSRLWKEFRTYNKRRKNNANTSRQKNRLERAEAATLLRENILMRKHWSVNIQSNNVIILHTTRNSTFFGEKSPLLWFPSLANVLIWARLISSLKWQIF